MARGWESKSVEAQQEEQGRSGPKSAPVSVEDAARLDRRRTLELALARARADLASATIPAHRAMLEAAIAALDQQLKG